MFLGNAPLPASPTQLMGIPDGAAGARATLRLMAQLVRQSRIDQSIRNLALTLIQDTSAHDNYGELCACFNYVRDAIRYTLDTNNVEVLQSPEVTAAIRQGDCDDKSTLLAAMLESIGHPCRFVAIGYSRPNQYEHVYVESMINGEWISCDATEQVNAGWAPMPPYTTDTIFALMREAI